MAKRPSKTQILARQARLARYQREARKTDKQVAKDFGITVGQLRNFRRKPSEQTRGWSHNKASQKLFEEIGAPSGKGSSRISGVRVTKQRADIRILEDLRDLGRGANQQERLFIYQETVHHSAQQRIWRDYADKHELPYSYRALRDMYESDELSKRAFYNAIRKLHEAYGRRKGK